jgi:hypothetical protein
MAGFCGGKLIIFLSLINGGLSKESVRSFLKPHLKEVVLNLEPCIKIRLMSERCKGMPGLKRRVVFGDSLKMAFFYALCYLIAIRGSCGKTTVE